MAFIPERPVLMFCKGMFEPAANVGTFCKQLHSFFQPGHVFKGLFFPKILHAALNHFADILLAFF